METDAPISFRARIQRLIAYQDVFARNNLLAQRNCEPGLLRYCILSVFDSDFK
jgi:hypothetical protein